MSNIISTSFNDISVSFLNNGYLNATNIAKALNKQVNDYLRLDRTQSYIIALAKNFSEKGNPVSQQDLVIVKKGNSKKFTQGTWLHPKLAIDFARWLNVEFAIWCDEQIEKILIGKNQSQSLTNNTNTTVDDRTGLRDAVNMLVSKKGLIYSDAYNLVHQYMNVKSIDEISKVDLPKAVEYVHRIVLEGELIEPKGKNVVEIPYDVADALVKFHRFVVNNAKKAEHAFRVIHEAMGYERYIRNDLAADNFDIHNEFHHWISEFEEAFYQSHRLSLLK
ncbi:KilA-N domain-containing protein [Gallibacterium genomosp. 3]|uniref:KilA-N domain-containing protein n=1 Tax=Gallibacterium genomosp. 3 TaxID=505345 RepID=UPI0009F4033E|nr:KilA-N domain-containing protein [Gallibacterium genomosp. 3]